jgi:hypothetical protein
MLDANESLALCNSGPLFQDHDITILQECRHNTGPPYRYNPSSLGTFLGGDSIPLAELESLHLDPQQREVPLVHLGHRMRTKAMCNLPEPLSRSPL